MFRLLVFFCLWHLVGGVNLSVMEGDSVTLHINKMKIYGLYNTPEKELWIGPDGIDIVSVRWHGDTPFTRFHINERFGGRVQVDNRTGSLTIRNCRTSDSGVFLLKASVTKLFNVTVNARQLNLIITRESTCSSSSSSSSSSSESRCVLLCSVVNVSHVTLSWYKGNSSLSSISVSDVISSVSLHLEVEYQDTNTYGCVLQNSFTEVTEHPHISSLCQTRPNSVQFCGFTEAVIRLVLSAVVGVATVAIVVYDITSRRAEKKWNENA